MCMRILIKKILPKIYRDRISALHTRINYIKERIITIYEDMIYWPKILFYKLVINIDPKNNWAYENILELIHYKSNLNVIKKSKLFSNYFNQYQAFNPRSIIKWRVEVGSAYLMMHDIHNLQKKMQDYYDFQGSIINNNGLDVLKFKIITDNLFQCYNTHAYLDTHIKAIKLGWLKEDNLVQLIGSGEPIQNPVMLEYWKKYITVINDDDVVNEFQSLRKYLEVDISFAANINNNAIYIEHAKAIVQKEWEKQNRKPLMELTESDKDFGYDNLQKKGIPKDAWFVSLHVRDAGYKTDSYLSENEIDSYRNADIDAYNLLIDEIISRGGYVVRVGDPNMKPMAQKKGVFDYAYSDIRSNRMDIFLFSQCRFFVGVSSGPILTPVLFGVPTIMTNFVPLSGRPHAGNCLFIPKMLWLRDEQRYATFEEALSSDLGQIFTSDGYEEKNIDLIDNSPEELNEIVVEMLDQLDGNMKYTDEDDQRQNEVTMLYKKYSGYGDLGRIGNAFIAKHARGLLQT